MSHQIKHLLFCFIILITIIISSSLDTEIDENTYVKAVISSNEEHFILFVNEPKEQIMSIEFIFSNPSKYETITFNKYGAGETNTTEKTNQEKIPIRRLSSNYTENQTDLVINDTIINGKKVVFLKLDNKTDKIIFTVFKVKYKPPTNADYIYLKHRIAVEKPTFYITKNLNLNYELNKDRVNVSFSGISQFENKENNNDFKVEFILRLFDKNSLDNLIEFPNAYFLLISTSPLKEESLKLEGPAVSNDINFSFTAPLNNKLSQYMIIYAKASTKDEEEIILYENKIILIEEESKEEENKEEENKEEEEEESGEKGKISEDDIREKNSFKFYIIMGSFGGIVILVFISIMIYIGCKRKEVVEIDEEDEYKNAGVIRDEKEEDDD